VTAIKPHAVALNAICPYFTMFPLEFPKRLLDKHARKGQRVLDPFCGRGTTSFAARLAGLYTLGIDSNPVAASITAAKLATATPNDVVRATHEILEAVPTAKVPRGDFWNHAYNPEVLRVLCRLRGGLLAECSSDAKKLLRAIILGALHGPLSKATPSYFSNQCPRTYAPKPRYAVKFWRTRKLAPPFVDVLSLIRRRAERYLSPPPPLCHGEARLGDSRDPAIISAGLAGIEFDWIITSPPYYGMRTYVQDQWLRYWFLGGSHKVDYLVPGQVSHLSQERFGADLFQVWRNVASVCRGGARLVVRFGGIRDRAADPLDLVKRSLHNSGWRINTVHDAGSAAAGKRQADAFLTKRSSPMAEYDVWASLA